MNGIYAFPQNRRLLKSSQYQRVFDQPKYRISRPELLMLARPNNKDHARLGMIVSKKSVPKAHQRNRLKRLIRESFRMNQEHLPGLDIILLSRRSILQTSNEQFFRLILDIWDKLNTKNLT